MTSFKKGSHYYSESLIEDLYWYMYYLKVFLEVIMKGGTEWNLMLRKTTETWFRIL